MPEPTFDVAVAHRWFAIECNNAAWDLVEAANRTPDDVTRMIDLAHAARWHWSQVGTELNQQRAAVLLATAYIKAADVTCAVRWTSVCGVVTAAAPTGITAFDQAAHLGCEAATARLAGHDPQVVEEKVLAFRAACEVLPEAEERVLLERLYLTP